MPVLDASSALLPVVLALGAAVLWGMSDFGGGLLGRRAPILGVLIATQGVGFTTALLIGFGRGETMPAGNDLGLGLIAGCLGAVGVGCLYGGLAVGRMGIVAPVTGVLSAVTPAIVGIVIQGAPAPIVILGFGIAIVAVVIVSMVPDDGSNQPTGLPYAVVGGVTLGLLGVVLSRIQLDHVFLPLAVMRVLEIVLFLSFVAVRRAAWRMPRSVAGLVLFVGVIDVLGNVAFLTAARIGELSVAAMVSSLYPVVTVILAATVVREQITRLHAAGVALALLAIGLITGGST